MEEKEKRSKFLFIIGLILIVTISLATLIEFILGYYMYAILIFTLGSFVFLIIKVSEIIIDLLQSINNKLEK